jgi:8-oxo-dGTP pyrophosphatase MutT (NUDIX family)
MEAIFERQMWQLMASFLKYLGPVPEGACNPPCFFVKCLLTSIDTPTLSEVLLWRTAMKTIFVLDEKNYTEDMPAEVRYTVRALIEREGRLAMQKSASGDYKIPGGGMEPGEDRMEALAREVLEETGLTILRDSVQEIGETIELRRDACDETKRFVRYTYFYRAEAGTSVLSLHLTESEKELGFTAVWADPNECIAANRRSLSAKYCTERDTKFLEWYVAGRQALSGAEKAKVLQRTAL